MLQMVGESLRKAAEYLSTHKQDGGCYHWIVANKDGCDIAIVLGWSEGWDKNDPDRDEYWDGEYRLATKVAYQPSNSMMQCDYELDWRQMYDKDSGDIFDTELSLSKDSDFDYIAKYMNKSVKDVLKYWKKYCHD